MSGEQMQYLMAQVEELIEIGNREDLVKALENMKSDFKERFDC